MLDDIPQKLATPRIGNAQKSAPLKKSLDPPSEELFTEVFSWGNDGSGQLGLGPRQGQTHVHCIPRYCSFNVQILHMACGAQHSVFITSKLTKNMKMSSIANNLVYSMGSNEHGQLGLGDVTVTSKYSPVLIEAMMDKDPVQV